MHDEPAAKYDELQWFLVEPLCEMHHLLNMCNDDVMTMMDVDVVNMNSAARCYVFSKNSYSCHQTY